MAITEARKRKIEEEEKYRAQIRGSLTQPLQTKSRKNRIVAALLAIFLGDLGIHKFYLNQPLWGLLYFIFSWTVIPWIIAVIEGIIYLTMSDQSFKAKYA